MKTLAKRAWLLAGLILSAILLPAWAADEVKAPANKQDAANVPKGQRVFLRRPRLRMGMQLVVP